MPIRLTPAVKILAIAYLVIFVFQQTMDQFFGGHVLYWLALVPSGVFFHHRLWQLITYSFLHGEVMHLFLNLLILVFIGGELEGTWGTAKFLRYYFFCILSAALFYLFLKSFHSQENVPMIGASGGMYGLLMAYGLIFGERILLFMMIFPMKAKYFVWVLAGIEFLSSVFSGSQGLASVAHLGGMAAGFGYLWGKAAWVVSQKRRQAWVGVRNREKKRKASRHLKLVVNEPHKKSMGSRESKLDDRDPDDDSNGHPRTWH